MPSVTESSTRSPSSVKPQAMSTPSLGPSGRTARKVASRNRATRRMSYRSRRRNCSKRSRSSVQIRWAVDFATFPSPAFSPRDSTSRIDSPRTNAPITIARNGSVATSLRARGNSVETNVSAASRPCGNLYLELALAGLHRAGAKPVAQPRVVVAQPALIVGPALIPSTTQPRVELVLHRALDDQPGPEPRELRQRLPRVLTHPHGEQLIDPLLDLR